MRSLGFIWVVVGIVLFPCSAVAQLVLERTPTTAAVGDGFTIKATVSDEGPAATNVAWECRINDTGCSFPWMEQPDLNGLFEVTAWIYVASRGEYKCTVWYEDETSEIETIFVTPSTSFYATASDLNTDVPIEPPMPSEHEIHFPIHHTGMSPSWTLGPQFSALAQERITRSPPWANPAYDSGWVPAEPDPSNFWLDTPGSQIVDRKVVQFTSGWENYAAATFLMNFNNKFAFESQNVTAHL